jgi:YD repeat-containing protein
LEGRLEEREVRYGYDSLNRLKTVTYPDGGTIVYQYDASGRMSGIKTGAATWRGQALLIAIEADSVCFCRRGLRS